LIHKSRDFFAFLEGFYFSQAVAIIVYIVGYSVSCEVAFVV